VKIKQIQLTDLTIHRNNQTGERSLYYWQVHAMVWADCQIVIA